MLVIRKGTVVTKDGTTMEAGDILVENGKITAVGRELSVPPQAEVIDASGKYVTPGIIDVHTHLGVHELGVGREGADFNETSSPVTPYVRALDGINPFEEGFQFAIRSGVTTIQSFPGSANVIGGEIVALKTFGQIVDHMVIKSPSGMKAAFGENPKRVYGAKDKAPVTRMGIAALFRQQFMKAQDYLKALEKGDLRERDLGMEQLAKVLRGEIPLRAHAHRADDIVTVLRLADEFGIEVTIEHCTEGHLITEFLAEKGVRVSVGPTMSAKSKVETADKGFHTLIELAKAGVPVSITTDHPVVGIEYLVTTAAHAVSAGLDEKVAWQMITTNAAKHIGVDDRVGSIEAGKDADIVIWSGNPFDIRNRVEKTIIDGNVVYTSTDAM
jgi:imidazolonepropionase-like amidohydrolase